MTKEEYKDALNKLKANTKRDIKNLKNRYEKYAKDINDGDILNSIYVRKIFYKTTISNIKRTGFFKFFIKKFKNEIQYYYAKIKGTPANLKCPWKWRGLAYYIKDSFNTCDFDCLTDVPKKIEKEMIKIIIDSDNSKYSVVEK